MTAVPLLVVGVLTNVAWSQTKPLRTIAPTTQSDRIGHPIESITPDERYQGHFAKIITEMQREGTNEGYGVYVREVGRLLDLVERDKINSDIPFVGEELCRQMIYYLSEAPKEGQMVMPTALRLARVMTLVTPGNAIRATYPFLDSPDPAVRKAAAVVASAGGVFEPEHRYNWLPHFPAISMFEGGGDKPAPEPPSLIVEGIYASHPVAAVLTMKRLFGAALTDEERERLDEHVTAHYALNCARHTVYDQPAIDREIADLRQLSLSRHWWIRLYVAELMCKHKDLRDPQMVDRFVDDPHELVKKCVGAIKRDQEEHSHGDSDADK